MDHAIYTAMGAASQTLNQQAVTASNLVPMPQRPVFARS
ncbi:flagellar basal body protein [Escherichia coli]